MALYLVTVADTVLRVQDLAASDENERFPLALFENLAIDVEQVTIGGMRHLGEDDVFRASPHSHLL